MLKLLALVPLVFSGFFFFFFNKDPIKAGQSVDLLWENSVYSEEKGVTIIKIAFHAKTTNPSNIQVKPALPAPWQYLRKEIDSKGDGYIEIAYLTGSPNGYAIKPQEKLATLTFPKSGRLTIDSKKTSLMTKTGKQHPLSVKVKQL